MTPRRWCGTIDLQGRKPGVRRWSTRSTCAISPWRTATRRPMLTIPTTRPSCLPSPRCARTSRRRWKTARRAAEHDGVARGWPTARRARSTALSSRPMTLLDESALRERFEAAIAAAREAGALALGMVHGPAAALAVAEKGALDLCTEADRAAERLIRARLADRFGDAMLGEEYGGAPGPEAGTGRDDAPRWVVDPIDGTYNMVHGLPLWAVSIGFVQAGVPTLGVVYNPMRDELFAARLGHGATRNGVPITVSGDRHVDRPL